MSDDEILNRLYRKHTSWVLMAERMMPLYYSMTAEDVVQEVYLKIYQELGSKKLKSTTIIIDGQPNYAIVYLRIRNIIADMMRSEKSSTPLTTDIEDKEVESAAEFYEKIDKVIDNFQWFHKKLFKLYSKEFRSIRKLSNATKISYKTVFKTVKECKEEIRKQIKNEK
jgi:RNA polymerase sigma factor (sigma-70 family)|tara:strand:+ start:321 stop:824 length:504 start_codon:yes stop_codon:yes gene_type:complete